MKSLKQMQHVCNSGKIYFEEKKKQEKYEHILHHVCSDKGVGMSFEEMNLPNA